MNTVEPKDGLSNAFFGTAAGVMVLAILQVVASVLRGGDVQVIPTVVFDTHPLKFTGDYLSYFFTTSSGLVVIVATVLFYIVGTYYVRKSKAIPPSPDVVEDDTAAFMRGLLIGFASGMNFVLAYNLYGAWLNPTIGLIIALVLFVLGILGSVKAVSQSSFYQGMIGWLCWLAPMSWPVLILGLVLLVLSLVLGLVGLLGVNFLKVGGDKTDPSVDASVKGKRVTADWATGTFFLVGGLAGNANPQKTAFNMGSIGFIHRKAQGDHRNHEAGHNLNLFVFGWLFHFIGAIDELVGGKRALAERLAASHDSGSSDPMLLVWA